MAEQFKRTYISATEFIDSWEKEIYELTNLDYFSFLLINELASEIEQEFFVKIKGNEILQLSEDEIITLSFNIADSLQNFLEKNCFGNCKLYCPCRLDELLDSDKPKYLKELGEDIKFVADLYQTKEQCLSSDILNYVILDSILDFYNYDLGIVLNENDDHLLDFAEFILNKIILFIRSKDKRFLNAPTENATELFNEYMQLYESSWQEKKFEDDEEMDDEEEPELWKIAYADVGNTLDEFSTHYAKNENTKFEYRLINKFKEYLLEYLGITKIEELTMEDLDEFFSVVLPHELLMEDLPNFDHVSELFYMFLTYLEFNHNLFLKIPFEKFATNKLPEIIRTFKIAQSFQKRYPLLHYLLSADSNDHSLVEGFFEIQGRVNDQCVLKDIHLKTRFEPVKCSLLCGTAIKAGDILHLHLIIKDVGWEIAHLEMVYPPISKHFLY